MCYVLTDQQYFIGMDSRGRPTLAMKKKKAHTFKTEDSAKNFLHCIPSTMKQKDWKIYNCNEETTFVPDPSPETNAQITKKEIAMMPEMKKFGNPTKKTVLESEGFDLIAFFTQVIEVMSELDRFIANMASDEEITDMKILDIRHYIRDNEHKLSAIQMQRLGYYLQSLEKERYQYKANRLIASTFVNSIDALKNKSNIDKMNNIVNSKYRPKVLDDTDIEYIINKKKEIEWIA